MKAFIVAALAAAAAASPVNHTSSHGRLHGDYHSHKRTDAPYGDKKGLAYNDGSVTNVLSTSGSATWAYNWGTAMNAPKFQQIPMMWGPGSQGDVSGIWTKINSGDTPWVLGYNEPDQTYGNGGCQKTPQEAYDAWGNDMFQFQNAGVQLVCPAISSWDTTSGATGGPSGLTWLRDFATIGNNPSQFRCTAQALHWYGVDGQSGAAQAQLFINYIASAHNTVNSIFGTNMLIWVTEFSPLPLNNAQILSDFLAVAIPWLDQQDYIDRYSPFMAEYMVTNGALNIAGQTFVNTF